MIKIVIQTPAGPITLKFNSNDDMNSLRDRIQKYLKPVNENFSLFIKDRVGGRLHLVPARDDITHLDGKTLCLPSADWGIPADPQGGPYPKGVKVHLGFSSFDTKDDKPDLPWDTEDIEELYALQETLLASLQTAPTDSTKRKRVPSVDVKKEDSASEPAKKKTMAKAVRIPEVTHNRLTRASARAAAKVKLETGN